MPTITITVTDAIAAELVDALCAHFNYRTHVFINDVLVPNPETRAQFARRMHLQWLKRQVLDYREELAKATADQTEPSIT